MYSLLDGSLTLDEEIREGAAGTRLWFGRHRDFGNVVVKIVPRPVYPDELKKRSAYFQDEVECGRIQHPHVRRLLAAGELEKATELGYPNGVFYLIFERMECSLADLLQDGPLDPGQVRDLVWAVATGLEAAHRSQRPVVHRDLKPSNILLADSSGSSAKVADFGIARMEGGTRLTSAYYVGTERYMAPEQFERSSDVDACADIYALALVTWECLTGAVPYDEGDPIATRNARREGMLTLELVVNETDCPALAEVLGRALEPDARNRPRSVLEFAADIVVAGIQDNLWDLEARDGDLATARVVCGRGSKPAVARIEDRRDEGGPLWVRGPHELGLALGALAPGVEWFYSEHFSGWFTKDASVQVDQLTIPAESAERHHVIDSTARSRKRREPDPAFMRPMRPDKTLGEIVGTDPMPRTEITKKLWNYIKRNNLQDAKNKRMINADAKLARVFGGKQSVSMFEMTKLVSKHMT